MSALFDYSDDFFEQDAAPLPDVGGGGAIVGGSRDGLFCPNCGSRQIEQQDASGASVCMECGVVVEENAIVSSVEFVEGAGGASSMVGQFVSATSSKAYTGGGGRGGRGGYGFSRQSRETTLNNGRRRIQEIASRLRLPNHFIDSAHRLFTIAVEKNFVQGRRTTHVVAACLYIVCRQERSKQMLIDFSDALQVNVYTLGLCFLKFRRLLGLKLEIIDPALYVSRFAAHLDLDEKANAVSMTALRLVARMKRDWIVAGRRPAGICAAALLIAARAHGFSKHQQDVSRILKVCGLTVNNRVKEFELTEAANLTLDQFHKVEIETEADPPAYSRNKILEARAKAIQDGDAALLNSGALDNPMDGPRKASLWRTTQQENESKIRKEFNDLYATLEKELGQLPEGDTAVATQATEGQIGDAPEASGTSTQPDSSAVAVHESQLIISKGSKKMVPPEWKKAYPRQANGKLLVMADDATPEEMLEPLGQVEGKLSFTEWKETMPDSMNDELDDIFRTEEEEMQKEAIFNKINQDYLEQLEQRKDGRKGTDDNILKKEEGQDDEAAAAFNAAQIEGHARYTSKRRNKRAGDDDGNIGGTVEEQFRAAVSSRRVSRKINYDALSSIFDDDGSLGNVVESTDETTALPIV